MINSKQFFSIVLTISFLISTIFGTIPVMADEPEEINTETVIDETFKTPDIIDKDEAKNYVGRLKEDENDLYTFVFVNEDGSNTMRVFGHPVKYIEDDGSIKDISLSLKKLENGCYKSTDHMIDVTFNPELKDGISLAYQDVNILMKCSDKSNRSTISEDSKELTYTVDNITSYVYNLSYMGIKENIVVNEYNGKTHYDFTITTNGLHPIRKDGSVYLADKTNNIKVNIGDVIVYTADGQNNIIGDLKYETIITDQEYKFTIMLDPDYLKDEKTTYPIIIDPSIDIKYESDGPGAIEDVTINQFYTLSGTATNLYVGRDTNTSLNRTLMRFPFLSLQYKSPSQIQSASVELTDINPVSNQNITIECLIYKKSSPAWSEDESTTWSEVGSNSYIGTFLDSHLVSSGHGNAGLNKYSFSILAAARAWADETEDPSWGLVFKTPYSFENQTGSNMKYWRKTFGSYNRTSNRPSLSITYKNQLVLQNHYSEYDTARYNISGSLPDEGTYCDEIRYRQNCYGYAFGYIYNSPALIERKQGDLIGYMQQPGEFAIGANKDELIQINNLSGLTASQLMARIVNNIYFDFKQLGFTITRYFPDGNTVDQFGGYTGKRLIAIVTTHSQFHFYMQHDDETWSHKDGSNPIQNTAFNSTTVLTNDNIVTMANKGSFSSGDLRFYKITKDAVMDYPHTRRCCNFYYNCNCNRTTVLDLKDNAGDYIKNAKQLGTDAINAKFDYKKDEDYYYFTPNQTKVYTIVVMDYSNTNPTIKCTIYDNCGNFKQSSHDTSTLATNIRLVKGVRYYFDIKNESNTVIPYVIFVN